jgi:rSAM/selenodomain-associated transferase 2
MRSCSSPTISIIIPALSEAHHLNRLLPFLKHHGSGFLSEIIVVGAGPDDYTQELCHWNRTVFIKSKTACRALQMNIGAERASGDIFYFVHADTLPPASFAHDIIEAFHGGYTSGCYRFKFDRDSFLLRINAWFTRFPFLWCRGGDQSLFVVREVFTKLGGFSSDMVIMEEYPLIDKLMKSNLFLILPKTILVSSRKYDSNSYWKVQWANFRAFSSYKRGTGTEQIKREYYNALKYRSEISE